VHANLAGDTARTAETNRPNEYSVPYDVMLSICTWWEKEEGTFGVMVFVFPSNHYMGCSPAFREIAESLPADGK